VSVETILMPRRRPGPPRLRWPPEHAVSVETILNFVRVSEQVATGGQPTAAQLQAARDEGCRAVVNLAPANAENHALPGEDGIVAALGMAYHHIPVPWSRPAAADFEAFCALMQELRGSKVLVHCAANFRVTAFYALYAMRHEGWSLEQADRLIARIWESRPDYRMDDTWKTFIAGIRSADHKERSHA
jgi:protein tyrosine phosphatase (PTP) superfamily phosphohydrolase (DUF442 family)